MGFNINSDYNYMKRNSIDLSDILSWKKKKLISNKILTLNIDECFWGSRTIGYTLYIRVLPGTCTQMHYQYKGKNS